MRPAASAQSGPPRFVRALVCVALLASAGARAQEAPRPSPVRVAVVGFSGDLPAAALSELAVSIRDSLQRQADPKALVVVSRDEMGVVYRLRGAPCSPEDFGCIVEASEAWAGRLFVRGVVRNTSDGIIVTATLESVRGFPVAAAQTPVAKGKDVAVAVPILVRELIDAERAYRERMQAQAQQAHANPNAPASVAPASGEPRAPVKCKCLAIQSTYVPGELVVADDGVRFESAPTSGVKLRWSYGWHKVGRVEATAHGVNPALKLSAINDDELVVYFNLGNERDRCLAAIAQRRGQR